MEASVQHTGQDKPVDEVLEWQVDEEEFVETAGDAVTGLAEDHPCEVWLQTSITQPLAFFGHSHPFHLQLNPVPGRCKSRQFHFRPTA